jgi:hypothetical protein
MAVTDMSATQELLEAAFSVRSAPRLYNMGQLPLGKNVERVVGRWKVGVRWPPAWDIISWSNELVVSQLPPSKDVKNGS